MRPIGISAHYIARKCVTEVRTLLRGHALDTRARPRHACLRCARVGHIFAGDLGRLLIVWEGEPRNALGLERDADTVATANDLADLGCGHCVVH